MWAAAAVAVGAASCSAALPLPAAPAFISSSVPLSLLQLLPLLAPLLLLLPLQWLLGELLPADATCCSRAAQSLCLLSHP